MSLSTTYFRDQLLDRRQRLVSLHAAAANDELAALVQDIDTALERLSTGCYGICDVCCDHIETDRLVHDPLTRVCSDHLGTAERQRLDRDLALAREVQMRLLPQRGLAVDGWSYDFRYVAAGHVGGDYVDIIPLPSRQQTLLLVGDVAGKGVAASLLMTSLHATFRSLVPLGLPMSQLLARVNDLFRDSAPAASYATLAAAVFGPGTQVELYNAGHLPPLLQRRGWTAPIAIDGGLPLGMFPGSTYLPAQLELEPEDTLLFYTDGVVEAEAPTGEDFTIGRLAHAVASSPSASLAALLDRCVESVRQFVLDREQADDLTVVALRAAPVGARAAASTSTTLGELTLSS